MIILHSIGVKHSVVALAQALTTQAIIAQAAAFSV